MLSPKNTDVKENSIEVVREQLVEARKKLSAQEESMRVISENIKRGGTGGFVSPHYVQQALNTCQREVRFLEAHLKSLEDVAKEKNSVAEIVTPKI